VAGGRVAHAPAGPPLLQAQNTMLSRKTAIRKRFEAADARATLIFNIFVVPEKISVSEQKF
jgi:hypothetical protein